MSHKRSDRDDFLKHNTLRRLMSDKGVDRNNNTQSSNKCVSSTTKHVKCIQPTETKKRTIVKPKKTTQSQIVISDTKAMRSVIDFKTKAIGEGDTGNKIKPKHSQTSILNNNRRKTDKVTKSASSDKIISKTSSGIESNKAKTKPKSKSCHKIELKASPEIKFTNNKTAKEKNTTLTDTKDRKEGVTDEKGVEQFYKNQNFKSSQDYDVDDNRQKVNLETITKITEKTTHVDENFFCVHSDSDSDISVDPNDDDAIKKLKEFRLKNYFECHSAKSRINSKVYVTNLQDHNCSYRFYLNERLFPVPLNTDRNKRILCNECYLPVRDDNNNNKENNSVNGVIQAKVQIGKNSKAKDIILMVPVKEPLIIRERRKMPKKDDLETMYFGLIKLTPSGHSAFKENLPTNSFALRYEKGYRETRGYDSRMFNQVEQGDVIFI